MTSQRPAVSRSRQAPERTAEWEFKTLTLSRDVPRTAVRQMLTDHAEYGHWELMSVRLYMGGMRQIGLRRRVMRVARTV